MGLLFARAEIVMYGSSRDGYFFEGLLVKSI